MATKTYCDICGDEIVRGPAVGLMEVLPTAAEVGGRRAEHACESCVSRAFSAPARMDPKYEIERDIKQPLANVIEGATDLVNHEALPKAARDALAERLATCVATNARRITKALR